MNFSLSLLYEGQENLLILISALIIANIIQRAKLFNVDWISSRKMQLLVGSLFFGILPIEGRITASLPMLKEFSKSERTNKMAFVGYLSTHHYYLWSPIEKSVLIIMSGLHITYTEFLSITAPILIAYFVLFLYYVDKYVEFTPSLKTQRFPVQSLPFFVSVLFAIFFPLYYTLPIIACYYYTRFGKKEDLCINYTVLIIVASIIVLSNLIKANSENLLSFMNTVNFIPVLVITFVLSFLLGSSSKYAGLTVAVCNIFGIQYLSIVFIVEYIGYLLSPMHKCSVISHRTLKMSIADFYKSLIVICIFLFSFVLIIRGFHESSFEKAPQSKIKTETSPVLGIWFT